MSASDQYSSMYHLAGVKYTLYNPRLPTLRRMEMDSMVHKLSDEHSRTSTPCDHPGSFKNARLTTYESEKHLLPSLEITDTGRQLTRQHADRYKVPQLLGQTQMKDITSMHAVKNNRRCTPAYGGIQLTDLKTMDLGFSGYAVRFLSPKVTHSWRFCLAHNPSLDDYGQKPIPVETMNIFRTFGPAYK